MLHLMLKNEKKNVKINKYKNKNNNIAIGLSCVTKDYLVNL